MISVIENRLDKTQVITEQLLTPEKVLQCIETAQTLCRTIVDRKDLHNRSVLERFCNVVMGELAEQAVLEWIRRQDKQVQLAVDKSSGVPDKGYDLLLQGKQGRQLTCSVKSSISGYFSEMDKILDTFSMATKRSEVCDINIQVYFWLDLRGNPRTALPSEYHMAIIGWLGRNDLIGREYHSYNQEEREVANGKLRNMRNMESLLDLLA